MTVSENKNDLATSWQQYVYEYYYDTIREVFEKELKKSKAEGITNLNCIVLKVCFELDFSTLINYNPDFYDYFNTATPEELKGLVRESSVEVLQEMMSKVDEEVKLDKRQVSVEIFMKNLPCTEDAVLNTNTFYQLALPKLTNENMELKGIWESHPTILSGKIVSVSESFYLADIRTFSCTNSKCRNNEHVIRHVGFDSIEHENELRPLKSKPEVFIAAATSHFKPNTIQCHNCRENINEIIPFRSRIEFKIAKLKLDGFSCFAIDLLFVGSLVCSKVKLSKYFNLIGFPKLSIELPHQLNFFKRFQSTFYYEVYGVQQEIQPSDSKDFIKTILDWITNRTCETLKFPLLVLICQIIGSANGIHFNVSLLGIDKQIILKIAKILNLIFANSIGSQQSNSICSKVSKRPKTLNIKEEVYPFLVNMVAKNVKETEDASFLYTEFIEDDRIVFIPVNLSNNEEADIILKEFNDYPKLTVPKRDNIPNLSDSCVKILQEHFLSHRSKKVSLALKFNLNLLSKFAQISAISRNMEICRTEDAEFSIMIHSMLIGNNLDDDDNYNYFDEVGIMSPSISFDLNFTPSINNFKVIKKKK